MRLGQRERTALFIGAPVAVAIVLYTFAFAPPLDALNSVKQILPEKRRELQEVKRIAVEQTATETKIAELKEGIEKRGKGFDLGGFVSSTASALNLKERCQVKLVPQRPKPGAAYLPSSVDVSLEGVTLKELTDFLYRVDTADKLLNVDTITIALPGLGSKGLQVDMRISTLIQR
jgi:type II secretory pathway component PulM